MIDMMFLRRTIEATAANEGAAATVSRRWLEAVERDLATGNAAIAKLAVMRTVLGAPVLGAGA